MEISPANRISQIKPYFFAGLEKTFAELRESGMQIIRLDIGSPDMPPKEFIIDPWCRLFIARMCTATALQVAHRRSGQLSLPTIWIVLILSWIWIRKYSA